MLFLNDNGAYFAQHGNLLLVKDDAECIGFRTRHLESVKQVHGC